MTNNDQPTDQPQDQITPAQQQPDTDPEVEWLTFVQAKGFIQRQAPNLPFPATKSVLNILVEEGYLHGDNGNRSKYWCANCLTRLFESPDGSVTIAQTMAQVHGEGRRLVPLKAATLAETLNKKLYEANKESGIHLIVRADTIEIAAGLELIRLVTAPGHNILRYSQDDALRFFADEESMLLLRDIIDGMTKEERTAAIECSRTQIAESWQEPANPSAF